MSVNRRRLDAHVPQFVRDVDILAHDQGIDASHALDEELAMFSHTQFFDLDSGQNTDFRSAGIPVPETSVHSDADVNDPNSFTDFLSGSYGGILK
jgi:hypothetical protein